MKAERWRAGSAAGMAAPNAAGNAYSYETTFTETGIGTSLVMRNKVSAQLDENGLLTANATADTARGPRAPPVCRMLMDWCEIV